ncbi:MAG: DUF3467 domain-containing protein [Deltaproteobacteria bacterium]|nr:MAG: DUF3467 domain-containing protein [Deltaproteobacteria bacterium]
MSEKKARQVQLQIKLEPEVATGVYANLAMVNHTDAEFTIDFIYVQPQAPQATVRSRVITSPRHMKRLVAALQDNLKKYEAKFGPIPADPAPLPSSEYKN